MVDPLVMVQVLGNVLMIVGGWIMKTLWAAQKELAHDLAKLREELPQNYVAKDDWREIVSALFQKLDRIEEKVDRKEDKSRGG